MNRSNLQRGFTLVELMIYSVIASIAIVVGFHLWSNAAFSSVDTRIRHEMSRDMQEMLFFIEDDLARVGAKSLQEEMIVAGSDGSGTWNSTRLLDEIYMATTGASLDYSSFVLTDNDSLDTFRFKTLVYDTLGVVTGIDSVMYTVSNKQLIRRVTRWKLEEGGGRTVVTSDSALVVADHVVAFNISAGVHAGGAIGDTLFHAMSPEWEGGTDSSPHATLSNDFDSRSSTWTIGDEDVGKFDFYVFRDSSTGNLFAHDSLSKTETYRLDLALRASKTLAMSFNAPVAGSTYPSDTVALILMRSAPSQTIVPGVDTLYLFPVRDNKTENLSFEITPSASVPASNLQLRMRLAITSPNLDTEGVIPRTLTLSKITLLRMSGGGYQQVDDPTIEQKERTKSLDVRMTVRRSDARQKHGTAYLEQSFRKIVKIPNNGPVR